MADRTDDTSTDADDMSAAGTGEIRTDADRIARLCATIEPPAREVARLSLVRQLTLARPVGSLGRLDDVVRRIAAIRHDPSPGVLPAAVSVLAGDHGVAAHGTSAFRHGLTSQVLRLINDGLAPVNILAARVPARIVSADFGLLEPVGDQRYKVAAGTGDICVQDAMTPAQADLAVCNGIDYATLSLSDEPLLAVGEIGVGNTTATAALAARLLGARPVDVVGPGSGVDDATVGHKQRIVERALNRVARLPDDPRLLLAALGGFEIAGNVGVILAAAARRRVIVIDGTITAVSALLAVRMCPAVAGYLIAGHRSTEPAHKRLLDALGQSPLLALDMRLGMASGATLALGLVNGALAVADRTPSARSVGLAADQ